MTPLSLALSIPAMRRARSILLLPLSLAVAVGCASGGRTAATSATPFLMGQEGATARARADSLRYPYTQADIDFMSGMIHHHAQAIQISRWVPTHQASPSVQRLAERIINAQTDEITLMRTWLIDRNQVPPTVDSLGTVTMPPMPGMSHDAHSAHGGHGGHGGMDMPGMLGEAQLKELDAARGSEFDRLFLTYMMAHHRGAVTMVATLFASPGAGQDETVFKFAADVEVDQSTEIKRMLTMLLEMGFAPPAP
jgi:uncharacterized protein (DUF305 family)